MAEDIYRKMQQTLDGYSVGFPATELGVEIEILKYLFSEEDAAMFLSLSPMVEKPTAIAERLGRPVEQVAEKLEDMASRGLLFRLKKNDDVKYGATAFVHGIFEFQLPRMNPELADLMLKYFENGMDRSLIEAKGTFLRTIPVNKSVTMEHHIAALDDAAEILKNADNIVVTDCICRKTKDIAGGDCGAPREVCFMFGSMGQYYLDNSMGRKIDTDEAIAIVARAQEAGLVTQPSTSRNPNSMCNCCGDCCGVLASIRKDPRPADLVYSNHFSEVDADSCIECGECLSICPMGAIELSEHGPAVILRERCIGCGVCVPQCPSEAIHLKAKPMDQRKELPKNAVDQMMLMLKERGRL